ncbi:hypothetical protein pb186bvf_018841 [Paramecium bursaria]
MEDFLQQYQNLNNQNKALSSEANIYINNLANSDQAYEVANQILQNSNQQDHQFLACQLIFRRVRNSQNIQYKQLIENFISNSTHLSSIAIYQLCAAYAIIIINDVDSLQNIVQQIKIIIYNNPIIGLNIFGEIANQIKECLPKGKQLRVQDKLYTQKQTIYQIFIDLLSQDSQVFVQAIKTLEYWIQCDLQIFDCQQLLEVICNQILRTIQLGQIDLLNQLFDILYIGISKSIDYVEQYPKVNQQVAQLINGLMNFLLQIYDPNQPKSYAILVSKFFCDFKLAYIKQPIEEQVFNIMTQISTSRNKRISFHGFQFWREMDSKQNLGYRGLQIVQAIIYNCKLKGLTLTKEMLQGLPDDDDEKEVHGYTVFDYRENAKDCLYQIFASNEYTDTKTKFFQIFINNLKYSEDQEVLLLTEATLFIFEGIIDDYKIDQYKEQVEIVFKFILGVPQAPYTDVIAKTNLQIISQFNYYKVIPNLQGPILRYLLSYMNHQLLGPLAAAALDSISTGLEADQEIIALYLQFFNQYLFNFRSLSHMDAFICGLFNLSKIYMNAIKQVIQLAQSLAQNFDKYSGLQVEIIFNLCLQIMNWFKLTEEDSKLQELDDIRYFSQSLIKPILSVITVIDNEEFLNMALKMFRLIIRFSNGTSNSYILNISYQIFMKNPIKRTNWLRVIDSIAQQVQPQDNETINLLNQYLQKIRTTVIQEYLNWQDSDLIKDYVILIKTVLQTTPRLIQDDPDIIAIMQLLCQALIQNNAYDMQREILSFYLSFCQLDTNINQNCLQVIYMILKSLFGCINALNDNNRFRSFKIIEYSINQISYETTVEAVVQGLALSWGQDKNEKQILLLGQVLVKYVKSGKDREFKQLLMQLDPMRGEEIDTLLLEIALKAG